MYLLREPSSPDQATLEQENNASKPISKMYKEISKLVLANSILLL